MNIIIREYTEADTEAIGEIWNQVVDEGVAFPQEETLDSVSGEKFFAAQTYCGVAEVDGKVLGLYILHPNNIGRCGHICNASYAVSSKSWCSTASVRRMKRASECSSSTPSSGRTSTRAISMSASASNSSALSPAASE